MNGKQVSKDVPVADTALLRQLDTEVSDSTLLRQLNADTPITEQAKTDPTLGERLKNIIESPGKMMNQGLEKIKSGNPIAGMIDIIHGAIMMPSPLFGVPLELGKEIPVIGPAAAKLAEIPGEVGAAAEQQQENLGQSLGAVMDKIGIHPANFYVMLKNLANLTPEQFQDVTKSLHNLNSSLEQVEAYGLTPSALKLAGKTAGAIASAGPLENLPMRLESASLRQPRTAGETLEAFQRPARTAIEENIQTSYKGLAKVGQLLDDVDNAYKSGLTKLSQQGKFVNYRRPLALIRQLRKQYAGAPLEKEITSLLDEAQGRFKGRLKQYPDGKVPVDVAYSDYTQFRDLVRGKFDQVAPFKQEMYKYVARSIIDGIRANDPELAKVGMKERDLLDLEGALQRRLETMDKQRLIPTGWLWRILFRTTAFGATGGFLYGKAGAETAGALAAGEAGIELALDDPRVQHTLAVAIDRLQKMGGQPKPITGAAVNQGMNTPPTAGGAPTGGTPPAVPPTRPALPDATGTSIVPTKVERFQTPAGELPPSPPNEAAFSNVSPPPKPETPTLQHEPRTPGLTVNEIEEYNRLKQSGELRGNAVRRLNELEGKIRQSSAQPISPTELSRGLSPLNPETGQSVTEPAPLKGTNLAIQKGEALAKQGYPAVNARWQEYLNTEQNIRQRMVKARAAKDKAAINQLSMEMQNNQLIREEVESALGAGKLQSFTHEDITKKIQKLLTGQ